MAQLLKEYSVKISQEESAMHQPKIMVVDDDENILSAFGDFLKKEHCTMVAASSAEEAKIKLERRHVDILIADVRLAGKSGITFLLDVRRARPDLPVIIVTGFPDLVSEVDAKAFGADYFFLKPLDIDELRVALKACLRRINQVHELHL